MVTIHKITTPNGTTYPTDGLSAYQIAVDNGFTGTEAEWLASLKGADGKTPVRGTDYWTADDIATIETYCQNAILSGEW